MSNEGARLCAALFKRENGGLKAPVACRRGGITTVRRRRGMEGEADGAPLAYQPSLSRSASLGESPAAIILSTVACMS